MLVYTINPNAGKIVAPEAPKYRAGGSDRFLRCARNVVPRMRLAAVGGDCGSAIAQGRTRPANPPALTRPCRQAGRLGNATSAARLLRLVAFNAVRQPREPALAQVDGDVGDERLIARIREGEQAALGILSDRHAQAVYALLIRMVGDRGTAEELLQDAFLSVWRQAGAYDSQSRPRWASRWERSSRA